jgi:hypothetical protein
VPNDGRVRRARAPRRAPRHRRRRARRWGRRAAATPPPRPSVVGRGHVSLLASLDTWHSKSSRDIGHLLIYSRHTFDTCPVSVPHRCTSSLLYSRCDATSLHLATIVIATGSAHLVLVHPQSARAPVDPRVRHRIKVHDARVVLRLSRGADARHSWVVFVDTPNQ